MMRFRNVSGPRRAGSNTAVDNAPPMLAQFRDHWYRINVASTGQTVPTRGGRPRDPAIDDLVLDAARELLVEVGWEATTMRGVAARSGVSRAAVLRRWPSKAHLVLDAVIGSTPDLAPFDGVDAQGWIRWVAAASVDIFARPEVQAAAPGLLAALRDQPELRDVLWRTFTAEAVTIYRDQHTTSHDDADLDAKAIIVLAAGAALFASALAGEDNSPELHERIEKILLLAAAESSSAAPSSPSAVGRGPRR